MEKTKKINILIYTFLGIIIFLLACACYKTLSDHHKKEYLVVYNAIKEAAKECYLKDDCKDKITLKTLYDKNYIKKQIDPVTKEDMDENICLEYKNKEVKFCN
jgi:hypothetical protein